MSSLALLIVLWLACSGRASDAATSRMELKAECEMKGNLFLKLWMRAYLAARPPSAAIAMLKHCQRSMLKHSTHTSNAEALLNARFDQSECNAKQVQGVSKCSSTCWDTRWNTPLLQPPSSTLVYSPSSTLSHCAEDCAEACAEVLAEQCAEILAPNVPDAAYAHACTEGAAALHGDWCTADYTQAPRNTQRQQQHHMHNCKNTFLLTCMIWILFYDL